MLTTGFRTYGVPILGAVYLLLTLTGYFSLRDTWERDNKARILALAKKLEAKDTAEALAAAGEILDHVGERRLSDRKLIEAFDAATAIVDTDRKAKQAETERLARLEREQSLRLERAQKEQEAQEQREREAVERERQEEDRKRKEQEETARQEKLRREALAEKSKVLMKALRRLRSDLRTGLSLRDYVSVEREVAFEINEWASSKDAKAFPVMLGTVVALQAEMKSLRLVWLESIKEHADWTYYTHSDLAKSLFSTYPEANKPITEGGAIFVDTRGNRYLALTNMVPFIITALARKVDILDELLANPK